MSDVLQVMRRPFARLMVARILLVIGATIFVMGGAEISARLFYRHASLVDNLMPGVPGAYVMGEDFIPQEGYYVLRSDQSPYARSTRTTPRYALHLGTKTVRICTFGESATYGTPFVPCLSYSHYLQRILSFRWPHADFQVFNFAFPTQTYAFARQAVLDSLTLSPAYMILYCGHNETIGPTVYQTTRRNTGWSGFLIRMDTWIARHSVAYCLLLDLERAIAPKHENGVPLKGFVWEDHVKTVVQAYAETTEELIRAARQSGAQMLFTTPLRNLKDFPPPNYRPADCLIRMSSQEAESVTQVPRPSSIACYRAGRYFLSKGNMPLARKYFRLASDQSPGRCLTILLDYLRQLPSRHPGVRTVDLESKYESATLRILGDEVLVDSVHLRLDSHYQVALILADEMSPELTKRFGPPRSGPCSLSEATLRRLSSFERCYALGMQAAGLANVGRERWRQAVHYLRLSQSRQRTVVGSLGLVVSEEQLGNREAASRILHELVTTFPADEIDNALNSYFLDRLELRPLIKELKQRIDQTASRSNRRRSLGQYPVSTGGQ